MAGLRMMAAAGAVLAPLALAAREYVNFGDQIAKMSRRTGMGVEALSELAFAADRSGTGLEGVEKSVRRMQRSIYDLERGLSTSKAGFAALGLTLSDLKALSPEDQFTLIADRLASVADPSRRAALAMELFGRSGTELLPMLEGGAGAISRLREEARRLGVTVSATDAAGAKALQDAWTDARWAFRAVARTVGAGLAPALKDIADRLKPVIVSMRDWIDGHRPLVVLLAKLAVGLGIAGAVLVAVGTAVSVLVRACVSSRMI